MLLYFVLCGIALDFLVETIKGMNWHELNIMQKKITLHYIMWILVGIQSRTTSMM